jgi:hypothetical protein
MGALKLVFEYLDETGEFDLKLVSRRCRGQYMYDYVEASCSNQDLGALVPRIELVALRRSLVRISRGGTGEVLVDLAHPTALWAIRCAVLHKINNAKRRLIPSFE